jgi:hypothetical protein
MAPGKGRGFSCLWPSEWLQIELRRRRYETDSRMTRQRPSGLRLLASGLEEAGRPSSLAGGPASAVLSGSPRQPSNNQRTFRSLDQAGNVRSYDVTARI